jgi:hypothetical protein
MLRRINIKALGLSLGLTWAGGVFILGFASSFGYGVDIVNLLSKLYVGYAPTFTGSVVGATWAFLDAFLAGVVIAWLYNKFALME